jgi:hypothetical protein
MMDGRAADRLFQSLVVTNISARGSPDLARAAPTSASFLCMRGFVCRQRGGQIRSLRQVK